MKKKSQGKASTEKRQNKGLGRRRFPRVQFGSNTGISALPEAEVIWPDNEISRIFDLSYMGIAFEKPKREFDKNEKLKLDLRLGEKRLEGLEVKTVWSNEKAVGCEFEPLQASMRMDIDEFLDDPLIGTHLAPVDPQYFKSSNDFDYWFCGPKETHVFLWIKKEGEGVQRAYVQLDGQSLIYENGAFTSGGKVESLLDESYFPQEDEELPVEVDPGAPLYNRIIEVLSQVEDKSSPLQQFLQVLLKSHPEREGPA